MSELILPAATLFRFNSEMLSLGLSDLSQEDAVHRLKNGDGSSIAYLVGHITSSRYGLLKSLGVASENPFQDLHGAGVGSKDGSAYPPITELKAGWDEAAGKLHAALDAITDEEALAEEEGGFPIPDPTLRGRLTFIAWHESYHIGQIGILRTEMGYPSMRKVLYAAKKE
ncbi:MAG: DinB family protein [bacterium]|nr:DinB family protein [bacterium]